jgi:hypothetical protein
MVLDEGDLAPGRFTLRITPDGEGSLLAVSGAANVRGSNWLLRRMIDRSPFAEAAMTAAAAYVLARAAAERAEHPTDAAARRPRGNPAMTAAADLDGRPLASNALAGLRARGPVAMIERSPGGRLRAVHAGVPIPVEADAIRKSLAANDHWKLLPGWRDVRMNGSRLSVDGDISLCDLGGEWLVSPGPPRRATEVRGATRGAALAVDAVPDGAGALTLVSLYPRLEAAGYLPRKFIEAEPLLEHALALALVYVDAMSVAPAPSRSRGPGTRARPDAAANPATPSLSVPLPAPPAR